MKNAKFGGWNLKGAIIGGLVSIPVLLIHGPKPFFTTWLIACLFSLAGALIEGALKKGGCD